MRGIRTVGAWNRGWLTIQEGKSNEGNSSGIESGLPYRKDKVMRGIRTAEHELGWLTNHTYGKDTVMKHIGSQCHLQLRY